MKQKSKRKLRPDYDEIMKITNEGYRRISTLSYRNLLDNIHKGCYVESESTRQAGTVTQVIRNQYGLPVCLKVEYDHEGLTLDDYISVDRISLWEPYSYYVSDESYDESCYLYTDNDFDSETDNVNVDVNGTVTMGRDSGTDKGGDDYD